MSPLITGPMHDGGFWVAVLYLGLLSSVLAYGLLNFANSHLSVSETSLFSNVTDTHPAHKAVGGDELHQLLPGWA